jgi:DNA excision repair protein ERCC-4
MTEEQVYQPRRFVDTREPANLVDALLPCGFEKKALGCGDIFMMSGDFKKIGIERKEVSDFMNSIGDRLSSQLYRMTEFYDVSILLIEGKLGRSAIEGKVVINDQTTNWEWNMVWNYLLTWQMQGVILQQTASLAHTINRINALYVYFQKGVHTGGIRRSMVSDDRVLAMPHGVGEKTAKTILNKFQSLRHVAEATVPELLEVEGVGPKRANAIYYHFNREASS